MVILPGKIEISHKLHLILAKSRPPILACKCLLCFLFSLILVLILQIQAKVKKIETEINICPPLIPQCLGGIMIDFWPSDAEVPGSTPGQIFFFIFASRISSFASFHISIIFQKQNNHLLPSLSIIKRATEVKYNISSHWDLIQGPF